MSQFRNAVICIDDDPMILQVLGFQMEKFLNHSDTIIELYTEPAKALRDIKDFVFEDIEILFVIVDYQMSNLFSVVRAIEKIGHTPKLSSSNRDLKNEDAVILPGVGDFSSAMKNVKKLRRL